MEYGRDTLRGEGSCQDTLKGVVVFCLTSVYRAGEGALTAQITNFKQGCNNFALKNYSRSCTVKSRILESRLRLNFKMISIANRTNFWPNLQCNRSTM